MNGKLAALVLALLTLVSSSYATERASESALEDSPAWTTDTVVLDDGVIHFRDLEVPSTGRIATASGGIDLFTPAGWTALHAGDVLRSDDRVQVSAGATLVIVFPRTRERIKFSPAPKVRWFRFTVRGA